MAGMAGKTNSVANFCVSWRLLLPGLPQTVGRALRNHTPMNYPSPNWLLRVVVTLALALASLQAASFFALALITALPIPVYDLVDLLLAYDAQGISLAWLLPLHNSHAIPLPRLLLAADIWAGGGHAMTFTITALLARITSFALLALAVLRHAAIAPAWRLLTIAALALLLFRGFLLETVVIPNGYNYDLMLVFALAGMVVVAKLQPDRIDGQPWIAALAAMVASLCLASGVLLLPLFAAMAWLRRRRIAVLLPFLLAGLAVLAVYVAGYHQDNAQPWLPGPWALLDQLLHIAGSPWIGHRKIIGYLAAALLLSATLAGIGWSLLRLARLDSLQQLALMLLLYGLGSLLAVAVTRAGLGVESGVAGRYGLFTACLYAGLAILLSRLPELWQPKLQYAVMAGLIAGGLLLIREQALMAQNYRQLHMEAVADIATLRAGQRDVSLLRHLHADPKTAWLFFDLLQRRRLYGFGTE